MRNLSESCSFLKMRNKTRLNSILGTFDTITRTIKIDDFDLDNFADTIDSWLSYYTFYHEQAHYYQFTSSTLGLLLTCLVDVELELIAPLVNELDFVPPFINCVEEQATEFNKKIHSFQENFGFKEDFGFKKEQTELLNYVQILLDDISDIELFIFVLEGGFSPEKMEQITKNRPLRTNYLMKIYQYISQFYNHAGKDLSTFYDDIEKKLQESKIKLPKNNIIFMKSSNGLAFGYNYILEAHARYCELTRLLSDIERFNEPEVLVKVKNKLIQPDDYQTAYNLFTSIVANITKELIPFNVFVFCLVCDYTINIPIPQIPQIRDSIEALYNFNLMMPGPRFVSICRALNHVIQNSSTINIDDLDFERAQFLELKTLNEWNRLIYFLYDIISKETGYPSPISIANAFIENNYTFDVKNLQYLPFDYDNAVFLEACKIRIKYPLFFINPELFRLIDREKYIEISNTQGSPIMRIKSGLATLYNSNSNANEKQQGYLIKKSCQIISPDSFSDTRLMRLLKIFLM